ncbi:C/D box methylation guide ribonucleoprotein complex aNOP56 subunit [Candidatus Bathyarchaeota archaeon A05DMB-2]|jgi:nucleolar protein 56|nr:C/D box methylation guide ribonucleoprotein complex aNOP56 subunit [Candidatus Bathyarchaeota archaeon A05DMB-2]
MKAVIVQFPFGVVAFGEDGNVADKVLFSKKPQQAAKTLMKIESGKISEIMSLIAALKDAGYDLFVFESSGVADEVQRKLNVDVEVAAVSEADALRGRMAEAAVETGFTKDAKELAVWNRNVSMELAKLRVKGAVEKRDLIIAQAIQTLDDLDRTVNLFMGRTREWYGVHFPELDRLIEKHETYARLVADLGYRERFTLEALEKEGLPKERAEATAKAAEASMGADMAEQDLAEIQALSRNVQSLFELRKEMENYVDKTMEEVAPNTRAIAGALLGARLIAVAGSLQNLALKPASTIQVLGAEKALFRSLKTGARPPKHGLIFQHALLHDAKRWQRGKIARVIAGKLAIAARADAFGGKYVGDVLKAEVDKRIEEIKEKYKEPPPIQEKKPRPERREQRFERREQAPERRERQVWRNRRDRKRRKDKRARKG